MVSKPALIHVCIGEKFYVEKEDIYLEIDCLQLFSDYETRTLGNQYMYIDQ